MRNPVIACLVIFVACASGHEQSPDARATGGEAGVAADANVDGGGDTTSCPPGQVATSVAASGELGCATVDDATSTAVRARCSVYLGFRDSCNGCTDPPAKWSRTGPAGCSPGAGAGNACVSATLDDPVTPVPLATVDLDGNVNDDDKLYASLHCIAAPRAPVPAPCQAGWAISSHSGNTWFCTPISEAAIAYVGGKCAVKLGWHDSCDGCSSTPTKWGSASDGACSNGTGTDDTCVTTTLDGETVNLFGVNPDGDVNGDDKFYLGLTCPAPDDTQTTTMTQCPAGQFVVAIHGDGTFGCADPAAAFSAYVHDRCNLFFGWHDSCDGCTAAPTKWGKVGLASCTTSGGTDDTCADTTLGTDTLPMYGVSTDGDVNSDDTFYVGFRCTP